MKKAFKLKNIIIAIVLVLLLIQFIRIDKTNPIADPGLDYFSIVQAPQEIETLIKNSCYDCHSNQTVYPWYSNLAPVSWIIKSHVKEGRQHVNFSEWGNYPAGRRGHKNDACKEMIEKKEMPIKPYLLMHPEARLSEDQYAKLVSWFTNE